MTEVIHSMIEEGPSVCERCGGVLRRVLYPAGIIFKGSGFYRTDSRTGAAAGGASESSKGSDGSAESTSSSSSSEDKGGSSATGDSKPSVPPRKDAPKAADAPSG